MADAKPNRREQRPRREPENEIATRPLTLTSKSGNFNFNNNHNYCFCEYYYNYFIGDSKMKIYRCFWNKSKASSKLFQAYKSN